MKYWIHHILVHNHVKLSFHSDMFGKGGREEIEGIQLPYSNDLLLEAHLEILDHLQLQVKNSKKWIREAVKENHTVTIPRTVPGLGNVLSALVALEIDDIHRFYSLGKLFTYSGLVPTTTPEEQDPPWPIVTQL